MIQVLESTKIQDGRQNAVLNEHVKYMYIFLCMVSLVAQSMLIKVYLSL